MLSFHSSLSVPQDIMGCMFTLADIIQQLSSLSCIFPVLLCLFWLCLFSSTQSMWDFFTIFYQDNRANATSFLSGFSVAIPFFGRY